MLRIVMICGLSVGCAEKKEAPAKDKAPPTLTETEIERGQKACQSYADKICQCAQQKSELAKDCDLAKARPEAYQLAIRVAQQEAKNSSPKKDKVGAYKNARAIMTSCIEEDLNFKCE